MTELPSEMRRSSREPEQLRPALEDWLRRRFPDATVSEARTTSATGMSSDTILFSAAWTGPGGHHEERLVARLAPDARDMPVFPSYDLDRQFRLIQALGECGEVPVPRAYWSESDPGAIGTPFFVMGHVDGEVPPDLLPYNFGDSWLFNATPEQQRALQDRTVHQLARLHGTEPLPFLEYDEPGDTPLRRHVAHTRAWYEHAARDGARSPLIERAFRWLDEHWPPESPAVNCWGDARIGNVIYRDFTPAALLDWEMAGLGPRELDVAWCVYAHRGFEDLAHGLGLPGMPGFMRRDDVLAAYAAAGGQELRDLDFFETYAAIQFAIVYLVVGLRSVYFGERSMADDPDEFLYNREPLERMLAGSYFKEHDA